MTVDHVIRMTVFSGRPIASQAMAASTAAPWPGADGDRERQSRFNRAPPAQLSPGQKPGLFFIPMCGTSARRSQFDFSHHCRP
jgi:hypothetical protein